MLAAALVPISLSAQTDTVVRTAIHFDTRSEGTWDIGLWVLIPDATADPMRGLFEAGIGAKDKSGRKAEAVFCGILGDGLKPAAEIRAWVPLWRSSVFGDFFYIFPSGRIVLEVNLRAEIAGAGKWKVLFGPESNIFPRGPLLKEGKPVWGAGPSVALRNSKLLLVAAYQMRTSGGNMFRIHVLWSP